MLNYLRWAVMAAVVVVVVPAAFAQAENESKANDPAAKSQEASKVVFVPAKQLDSEIHSTPERMRGLSHIDLVEVTPKHSASVVRRTAPTLAEVHENLTDIWYVIEGGGTLMTGGSLADAVQTDSGELRGPRVSGGEERQIRKGDFVRIPAGVPHWVRKIDGKEIVYLVVKCTSEK